MDLFNTNVVGNIHLFNAFMPLVLKGNVKKVATISTGLADQELAIKYGIYEAAPYSISKAAMNMTTVKFQAEYQKDGVLFLSLSPGSVNTGQYDERMYPFFWCTQFMADRVIVSEEQQKGFAIMGGKFMEYAPHFKGPISVEESVESLMNVVNNASLEKGDAGAFLSHLGNKSWL